MTADLHFGPNVASDILPLFSRTGDWMFASAKVNTVQFYIQNILADEPGQMGVGPNTYPALVEVDAFRTINQSLGNISIEAGAVKEWSLDGRDALNGCRMAIERVEAAGGKVAAFALDEPKGAQRVCHLSNQHVVDGTCRVIDGIRELGSDAGLIEPYPYVPMPDLVTFFEALQRGGSSPAFWHLDVDRFGIRDQKISRERFAADLQWAQRQCRAWGIPFGVIVFGQRATTAAAYVQSALAWANDLRLLMGEWPDRIIVQSWERAAGGALTLPHNLPESDSTSHTALLNAVAQMVGRD